MDNIIYMQIIPMIDVAIIYVYGFEMVTLVILAS